MPPKGLSELQRRVLIALAGMQPAWTLTGGGALAGVHLAHRATRDLDLFWHGTDVLGDLHEAATRRLLDAGFTVDTVQTAPAFRQLRVSDGRGAVIVDLVADRVPVVEPPVPIQLGSATILVDTPHEILVNKLCALLGRAEARDLVDVRELLRSGLDLERALRDAPSKDGGFSPLTFAWVLQQPALSFAVGASGLSDAERAQLLAFRDDLVQRVMRYAAP